MPTSPAPTTPPSNYSPGINSTPIVELVNTDTFATWKTRTNELIDAVNSVSVLNDLSVLNVAADTARGCQEVRHTDGNVWIGINPTTGGPLGFDTDGSLKLSFDPSSFTSVGGVLALTSGISDFVARSKSVQYQATQTAHGFSLGTVVYLNTSGVWTTAYADSASTSLSTVGIVSTVVDVNTFIVTISGFVDLGVTNVSIDGTSTGFAPGVIYYVPTGSGNAGKYTTTKPTASGTVSRPVAIGVGHSSGVYNRALVLNESGKLNDCIRLDGTSNPSANISLNSHKITNLANGSLSGDAINYSQLAALNSSLSSYIATKFSVAGGTITGDVSLDFNRLVDIANGTNPHDAVNHGQLALMLPLTGGTMSGAINMGSTNKIVSLANGTTTYDAVNYGQLIDKVSLSAGGTQTINSNLYVQGVLKLLSNGLDANGNAIINVANGVLANSAVNLTQLNDKVSLSAGGTQTINSNLYLQGVFKLLSNGMDANGNAIINVANGVLPNSAVNLTQLNDKVSLSAGGTQTITSGLNIQGAVQMVSNNLNMNSNRITNLAAGTSNNEATNLGQVLDATYFAGGYAGYFATGSYAVSNGSPFTRTLGVSSAWNTAKYALHITVDFHNSSNVYAEIEIGVSYGAGLSTTFSRTFNVYITGQMSTIATILFPDVVSASGIQLNISTVTPDFSSFIIDRVSYHAIPISLAFQHEP